MIVFVDTESSDLLKRHLPLSDESQPWIVSIAADLTDIDGNTLDHFSTRIRADGRKIRDGAESIHGISSRSAGRNGVSEIVALGMLLGFVAQAKYCVGYGLDFDRQLVESMLIRRRRDTRLWIRPGLEFVNVMLPATPVCKIQPKEPRDDGSHKWPSLSEAQSIILGESPREGNHNAWTDAQITKRLFFELMRRGVIEALVK